MNSSLLTRWGIVSFSGLARRRNYNVKKDLSRDQYKSRDMELECSNSGNEVSHLSRSPP